MKDKITQGTDVISEVALRYFDVLVETLNRTPALFPQYKDLVERLIGLYGSDDLLSQLNSL